MAGFAAFLGTPAGTAAIGAGVSLLSGLFGSRRRKRQQREAKGKYNEMKAAYEGLDTSNIYANVQNPYENIQNPYANMENTMEDLRVNTQQADFMAQQGAQARADILGTFKGAAGGSGIAALAQSLANQQTQQAGQISASIGQQETANQRARAIEAGRLQQLERTGEFKAESMRLAGEQQAESMRLAGANQARALEYQTTGTMFGMSQQRLAGANQAVAAGQRQMASGIGGLATGFAMGQFGDVSSMFGNSNVNLNTSTGFNPYGVTMDYQQMVDRPISINDPNPPELTSFNIPGAGNYSGGFKF